MESLTAASRLRRLKLQTSYGLAMTWSKGYVAEETKAALAQTQRLAAQSDNVAERVKAHFARWVALFTGGELKSAPCGGRRVPPRGEIGGRRRPPLASAERALGLGSPLYQGRFAEARRHCREALSVYSPGLGGLRPASAWDRPLGFPPRPTSPSSPGPFGDHDWRARFNSRKRRREALASEHAPTIANAYLFKVYA